MRNQTPPLGEVYTPAIDTADNPVALTPSDTTDVSTLTTKGLLVASVANGDALVVRGCGAATSGTSVPFTVVVGQYLGLHVSRVMTGTTATIVGLS